MCMQDLAISARVTVRRTVLTDVVTIGATNVHPIPISPLRLWCYVADLDGGSPIPMLVRVADDRVQELPAFSGVSVGGYFASTHSIPGIFNTELWVTESAGNRILVEGIMDSDLSKAVQAVNTEMSTMGG